MTDEFLPTSEELLHSLKDGDIVRFRIGKLEVPIYNVKHHNDEVALNIDNIDFYMGYLYKKNGSYCGGSGNHAFDILAVKKRKEPRMAVVWCFFIGDNLMSYSQETIAKSNYDDLLERGMEVSSIFPVTITEPEETP